jgi:hypothetical protein
MGNCESSAVAEQLARPLMVFVIGDGGGDQHVGVEE